MLTARAGHAREPRHTPGTRSERTYRTEFGQNKCTRSGRAGQTPRTPGRTGTLRCMIVFWSRGGRYTGPRGGARGALA
ncbi:hypothetical protein FE156_18790 [Streptomyces albidoflavus]|nr:hypothetical protein FE156_18790 [Streptomyces albidoflavus]